MYFIDNSNVFPPVNWADTNGLLAVGGDLSPQRLLAAYSSGIFPWFNEDNPVLWWAPDPRFILTPATLHISKSMRKIIRDAVFEVTIDRDFDRVIGRCRSIERKGQEGTWITAEMLNAYRQLHEQGYAHSVEVWKDGVLAGGLYGVSLGSAFFGESMFADVSNASKVALIALVETLKHRGIELIDCQVYTDHLKSMGAYHVSRDDFMMMLKKALKHKTAGRKWSSWQVLLPKV